jgi:hypothetical protein
MGTKEKELEEFKKDLRDLVVYTLPKKVREDKDIVDNYFDSFLFACEEYKRVVK